MFERSQRISSGKEPLNRLSVWFRLMLSDNFLIRNDLIFLILGQTDFRFRKFEKKYFEILGKPCLIFSTFSDIAEFILSKETYNLPNLKTM